MHGQASSAAAGNGEATQPQAPDLTGPSAVVEPRHSGALSGEFAVAKRPGLQIGVAAGAVLLLGAALFWWQGSGSSEDSSEDSGDSPAAVAGADDGPPPGEPDCDMLTALAGSWRVTTEVTGAGELAPLGLRGYYDLEIEVTDCSANGSLVKKGYTGKRYTGARLRRGTAELSYRDDAVGRGWGATFSLLDDNGRGADQQFVFASHEDRLVGTWRQRGAKWTSSGLSGFLEGLRPSGDEEERLDPELSRQPCTVRCAIACDGASRDQAVPADALSSCRDSCRSDDTNAPACGDATELPAEYRPEMFGPAKSVAWLCGELGRECEVDPRADKSRTPDLKNGELDGSLRRAHFVWTTDKGDAKKEGDLRLAVKTSAGWFMTGALLPGESGEPVGARIFARALGGRGRRYILGRASQRAEQTYAQAFVVCAAEEDQPRCAAVPVSGPELSEPLLVSPLPGRTLSLSVPSEVSSPLATGLYRW